MCDPITIAGLALTAGATVANTMAQNKVAKARSQVMEAERIRQNQYDQEAQALNTQSQDRYKTFGPDMEKRGAELGGYFANQTMPATDVTGAPTEIMPQTDSTITVQETGKQKSDAAKYTGQQAQALGNLRSFGDYLGGVSRQQAREAGLIGQIGGFKKGSSEVTPFELDAAGHKGDSLKMLGDVLQFAGGAATGKGLQGDWATVGAGTNPVTLGGAADPWGTMRSVTTRAVPTPRPFRSVADLGLSGLYGGPR